ncbi:glycosyltransferase [Piscinibacter sp. HJYY11]|uniref:glycosyltransferase n=1 Tax=Piscinibacter sp. HJYY11 TaxID=2801333 RepID=UPI00191FB4A3|nr:glycosyltransferase [Piscinibacter sp. HJYY11]MBL0726187.1 glycosyltransferase [Piscinibacter sp. HJYY11]
MRLLNVIRSIDPAAGGMAEGLRQSVIATREMGHTQEVLTLDAPTEAWVRTFPAPVHALGPVRGVYGHCASLISWLRSHASRYDAVVVHGLWQYHTLAVHRALAGGPVPYFVYPHGMLDPWFKRRYPLKHLKKWLYWPWADYRTLRDAAAVFFTAEEERRLAAESFWLYRVKPEVVGYGVTMEDASQLGNAGDFVQNWPETRGKHLMLFLARLHEKKGADLLIDAFAQVAADMPSLHLVMAGPEGQPGLRARLEARARTLGVSGRITWTGMLTGHDKWSALKAADVFVLPSHQENFGVAVVEALALGVPVLVSDKVNIWREVVTAGAGFAADDTVGGTAQLLRQWMGAPQDEREAMRLRAAACYAQHFDMTAAARRLVSAIERHRSSAGVRTIGSPEFTALK